MHNQFAKRFLACAIATLTAATAIVPNGTVFASVLSSNQSTLSQSVTSDIMISDGDGQGDSGSNDISIFSNTEGNNGIVIGNDGSDRSGASENKEDTKADDVSTTDSTGLSLDLGSVHGSILFSSDGGEQYKLRVVKSGTGEDEKTSVVVTDPEGEMIYDKEVSKDDLHAYSISADNGSVITVEAVADDGYDVIRYDAANETEDVDAGFDDPSDSYSYDFTVDGNTVVSVDFAKSTKSDSDIIIGTDAAEGISVSDDFLDGDIIIETDNASDFTQKVADLEAMPVNKDDEFSTGRIIVKSDEDISENLNGGTAVKYDDTYVVSFDTPDAAKNAYESLSDNDGIEVYPDAEFATIDGNATGSVGSVKADYKASSVDELLAYAKKNDRKVVAIVDTGVDSDYASYEVDVTGTGAGDRNGHGTFMAKTALSYSDGDALILSVKAIGSNGIMTLSSFYSAVQYLSELDGIDVINMSFSGNDPADAALAKMVENLAKKANVVCSAGNNGSDVSGYFPANVSSVDTIGACDENGKVLSSSNRGDGVDFYAAGQSTSQAASIYSGYLADKDAEKASNGYVFKTSDTTAADASVSLYGDDFFHINDENLVTINLTDTPITGKFILRKRDKKIPTLNVDETYFKVEYFTNYNGSSNSGTPERTWYWKEPTGREDTLEIDITTAAVVTTNAENGLHGYTSDPFYINSDGKRVFPLGTYKITEVRAHQSYDNDTNVSNYVVFHQQENGVRYEWTIAGANPEATWTVQERDQQNNVVTKYDTYKRAGVKFVKFDHDRDTHVGQGSTTLEDAVIAIYADENIEDYELNLNWTKGEVMAYAITDGNGDAYAYYYAVDKNYNWNSGQTATKATYHTADEIRAHCLYKGKASGDGIFLPVGTSDETVNYYAKEQTPPYGYNRNDDWKVDFHFDLSDADSIKSLDATSLTQDEPGLYISFWKYNADVYAKKNVKNYNSQGDGTLDGTTFTIYNRSVRTNGSDGAIMYGDTLVPYGEVVDQLVITDGKTAKTLDKLPIGHYDIVETIQGEGYLENNQGCTLDITEHTAAEGPEESDKKLDYKIVYNDGRPQVSETGVRDGYWIGSKNDYRFEFYNYPKQGGIKVLKYDSEWEWSEDQGDGEFAGTQFTIYNISERSVFMDVDDTADVKYAHTDDGFVEPIEVDDKHADMSEWTDLGQHGVVANLTIQWNGHNYEMSTDDHALPYGTYLVKETKPAKGYKPNSNWYSIVEVRRDGIIYDSSQTSKVDTTGHTLQGEEGELAVEASGESLAGDDTTFCADDVFRGGISVTKFDEDMLKSYDQGDGEFDGTVFTVYNISTDVGEENAKVNINKPGSHVVAVPDTEYATYAARDVDSIYKNDHETSIAPYTSSYKDMTLANGTNGACVDLTIHWDDNKKAYFSTTSDNALPYGTYLVKETKAAKGYLLDEEWYAVVKVAKDGYIYNASRENGEPAVDDGTPNGQAEVATGDVTPQLSGNADVHKSTYPANDVIRGGVELVKFDEDLLESYDEGDGDFTKAVFTIYNISTDEMGETGADVVVDSDQVESIFGATYDASFDGKTKESGAVGAVHDMHVKYDAASKTYYATTGENYADTEDYTLPYGTYLIKETVAGTGYFLDKEWYSIVEVRENGKIYRADLTEPETHEVNGENVAIEATGNVTPRHAEKDEIETSTHPANDVYRGGVKIRKVNEDLGYNNDAVDNEGWASVKGAKIAIINASKLGEGGTQDVVVNDDYTDTTRTAGKRFGTIGDDILGADGNHTTNYLKSHYSKTVRDDIMAACDEHPDAVVAYLTTDEEGYASTDSDTLPYGTYYLIEVDEPYNMSYEIDNDWALRIEVREDGKIIDATGEGNAIEDPIVRGDLKFLKTNENGTYGQFRPFVLQAVSKDGEVLERHVVVTDQDGNFNSQSRAVNHENGRDRTNEKTVNFFDKFLERVESEDEAGNTIVTYQLKRASVGGTMMSGEDFLDALQNGDVRIQDNGEVTVDHDHSDSHPGRIATIYDFGVWFSKGIETGKSSTPNKGPAHNDDTDVANDNVTNNVSLDRGALYYGKYDLIEMRCDASTEEVDNLIYKTFTLTNLTVSPAAKIPTYDHNLTWATTEDGRHGDWVSSDKSDLLHDLGSVVVNLDVKMTSEAVDGTEAETLASDGTVRGEKTTFLSEHAVLHDKVTYTHLKNDTKYRMILKWYDEDLGDIVSTQEVEFTPAATADTAYDEDIDDETHGTTKVHAEAETPDADGADSSDNVTNTGYLTVDGYVDFRTVLDTTPYEGHTLSAVAYIYQNQPAYHDDVLTGEEWNYIGSHNTDLEDENEKIWVPKISTVALDTYTASHVGTKAPYTDWENDPPFFISDNDREPIGARDSYVYKNNAVLSQEYLKAGIIDKVSTFNLAPNRLYILKETVVDKETGEKIDTSKTVFNVFNTRAADSTDGKHVETKVVAMDPFTVDSSEFTSKTLVVYEELWYGEELNVGGSTDAGDGTHWNPDPADDDAMDYYDPNRDVIMVGTHLYTYQCKEPVAVHKDINDIRQSIFYADVDSEAYDGYTRDHVGTLTEEGVAYDTITIKNTVRYARYDVVGHLLYAEDCVDKNGEEHKKGDIVQISNDSLTEDVTRRADEDAVIGDQAVTETYIGLTNTEKAILDDNAVMITIRGASNGGEASGTIKYEFDASALEGIRLVMVADVYVESDTQTEVEGIGLDEEILVAWHHDLNDEDEMVYFPKIRTHGTDKQTLDNVGSVKDDDTIVDIVDFWNLVPGMSYRIDGKLVYQTDFTDEEGNVHVKGEAVKKGGHDVTSTAKLAIGTDGSVTVIGGTLESSEYEDDRKAVNGAAGLSFDLDSSALSGYSVVAFEYLIHKVENRPDGDDVIVATHEDITDREQTVHYPWIKTSAQDAQTGSHAGNILGQLMNTAKNFFGVKDADGNGIADDAQQNIIDTVTLKNLVPGKTYIIAGKLYDVEASEEADEDVPVLIDGHEVVQRATITVSEDGQSITSFTGNETTVTNFDEELWQTDGTVDLVFELDSSKIQGTKTVVYETLYHKADYNEHTTTFSADERINGHEDLTDEGQSIYNVSISTSAIDATTQDKVGDVPGSELATATIVDTINMTKLVPGDSYYLVGTLVDMRNSDFDAGKIVYFGTDGQPVENVEDAMAQVSDVFVADTSAATTKQMSFTFDYETAEDRILTVFEALHHVTYDADGNKIEDTVISEHPAKAYLTEIDNSKTYGGYSTGTPETYNPEPAHGTPYAVKLVDGTHTRNITVQYDNSTFYDIKNYTPDDETFLGWFDEDGLIVYNAEGLCLSGKYWHEDGTYSDWLYDGPVTLYARYKDKITTLDWDWDEIRKESVYYPAIHTNAVETDTNDHVGTVQKKSTIVDTVTLHNLVPGMTYELTGTLYDQDSGMEFLVGNAPVTKKTTISVSNKGIITASGGEKTTVTKYDTKLGYVDGTVDLTYEIDASLLANRSIVVFEDLYHKEINVATHHEIKDKNQTVNYPDIHTNAVDSETGTHVGTIFGSLINSVRHFFGEKDVDGNDIVDSRQQQIIDTVTLDNLEPGNTYVVYGQLMNRTATEKAYEEAAGTKALVDCAVPVMMNGKTVEQHTTITVSEIDGDGLAKITSKEGNETKVTTVVPEENRVNGTVALTFSVDSSLIAGDDVVVFEKLYHDSTYTPEKDSSTVSEEDKVNEHCDVTDDNQTVAEVKISTTAIDSNTKTHTGTVASESNPQVSIIDDVDLKGLVVGEVYTLKGMLVDMDASNFDAGKVVYFATDGSKTEDPEKAMTVISAPFAAEERNEVHSIRFTFSSDLAQGRSLTVFEKLYNNNVIVTEHPAKTGEDGKVEWDKEQFASQTVFFPTGKTNAVDSANKTHTAKAKTVTINDNVYFDNLIRGKSYTIEGKLVYQSAFTDADGKAHVAGEAVKGADGKDITASREFIVGEQMPGWIYDLSAKTHMDGTVTYCGYARLDFEVDATKLAGAKVVAFETFKTDGVDVFVHADLNDLPQTVRIPSIRTTASAGQFDETTIYDENGKFVDFTITDLVSYQNLWTQDELTKMHADGLKVKASNGVEVATSVENIYDIKEVGTYVLRGVLMDKTTGKPLTDNDGNTYTAYKVFTPTANDGIEPMTFTLNAGKFLDKDGKTTLAGKTLVVYEDCFTAPEGTTDSDASKYAVDDNNIAEHRDIEDNGQDIRLPDGRTHAVAGDAASEDEHSDSDGHKHELLASEAMTITDRVTYKNLHGGTQYTVTGTLHTKDGEVYKDDAGNAVQATKVFTTEGSYDDHVDGYVDLVFGPFSGKNLAGNDVVAFETVTREGTPVIVHADINDEAQTVHVPEIHTNAADAKSGLQMANSGADTLIADKVTYKNLENGKTYTLRGRLYDKETGAYVAGTTVTGTFVAGTENQYITVNGTKVTTKPSEVGFGAKPDTSGTVTTDTNGRVSGYVYVMIPVNAAKLGGKQLVAFETLYGVDGTTSLDDKTIIAEHEDINDEAQTITIPEIGTKATFKNGKKTMKAKTKMVVVDTVSYEGLKPGIKYTLKGTLMDKKTGGSTNVTAEKTFTPKKSSGTVKLKFTFDGTKWAGHKLVAFEQVLVGEYVVASHEDITDKDQTVKVKKPKTSDKPTPDKPTPDKTTPDKTTTSVDTGDNAMVLFGIGILMMALCFAAFYTIRRKNRKK